MISVNLASYGKVGVIEIAGELDSTAASVLSQVIEEALEAEMLALVIDLSGIILLDIDGLRGLNARLKRVRRAGGDMRLAEPSDPALESLQAAKLDEIFTIFESPQAAVASF
ncbi:MAG: STAS domain-containing protein [Anaerolineaceae bacterium]|nr:STAS domain-containing protein [Anaerolineaceae bacterium]